MLGGEEVDPESPTGSRTVNRVTRYDCERQRWSGGPSMLLARRWAGALVVGESILSFSFLFLCVYFELKGMEHIFIKFKVFIPIG